MCIGSDLEIKQQEDGVSLVILQTSFWWESVAFLEKVHIQGGPRIIATTKVHNR